MEFSPWTAWSDRNNIPVINQSGVYLIATGVTRGKSPKTSDKRIIYIGHTTKSLRGRLNNFERSCEIYYGGHGGAQSFFKSRIGKKFESQRNKARQAHRGRRQVKKTMQEYIKRNRRRFDRRWEREKSDLSVAVWVPSEGDTGTLAKLPKEMRPTFLEMKLQAEFVVKHRKLPQFNKQLG